MTTCNQGWMYMEQKINAKTAQRRAAQEANRRARIAQFIKLRRWFFFGAEILLALICGILLANYIAGNIHVIVFQAFFSVVFAIMAFCAGCFLGATK